MKFDKNKITFRNSIIILSFVVSAYAIIDSIYFYYQLNYYSWHSTATIIGFKTFPRRKVVFSFKAIDGQTYINSSIIDDRVKPKIGEKFPVVYSERDPDVCRLEFTP